MNFRTWLASLSISPRALAEYQVVAELLKLLNGYSPFPLNIDLVLTYRCNFACTMCVCRKEENLAAVRAFQRPALSPADWLEVIENISKSFYLRPNLNFLGGEPSIYEGYLDVLGFAKQKGFRCSYTTNGSLLARDAAEIVSIGVDVIGVSIDGPREIHDSIRGRGAFERATEGIRAVNELKRMQGRKKPRLFLACAISGDNYNHFSYLVDLARDLGLNYVNFLHLQFPDSEIGIHGIDVDDLIQEMGKARRKAADHHMAISFYPHLAVDQIAPYYLQPSDQLGKGCTSPWLRMSVMPNGKVIVCWGHVVGDVRDSASTIKSIWNDKKFVSFRRKLAKEGTFPSCGRCCRKRY